MSETISINRKTFLALYGAAKETVRTSFGVSLHPELAAAIIEIERSESIRSLGNIEDMTEEKSQTPRPLSLVAYTGEPARMFDLDVTFLGEIPNKPGHCLVMTSTGLNGNIASIRSDLHTCDFRELEEGEI